MKRLVFPILLLASLVAGALMAQQTVRSGQPAQPNFLFDDDGGAVQIVPADLAPAGTLQFHGGTVMKSVQQVSIVLGAGWADAKARSSETSLMDLASSQCASFAGWREHGVRTLRAGAIQEDFADLSKTAFNDLNIQHKLADMLQSKAIPAPAASTVYVVFLAPEVSSSLGGNQPGRDYAAYHNFFHIQVGEIRYVVVPFNASAANQLAAVGRALAEAGLNPDGRGWF